MNVLTTSLPVGAQAQLLGVGIEKYATVQGAGAGATNSARIISGANPGGGAVSFTLTIPSWPTIASGTYLVSVTGSFTQTGVGAMTVEILLDGVAQPCMGNGATAVSYTIVAGALTFMGWTTLITASPGTHSWSARITSGSGVIGAPAGSLCLSIVELGN